MKFFFHEAAETEFDHAIAYYEECRPGLGLILPRKCTTRFAESCNFPMAGQRFPPMPDDASSSDFRLASFTERRPKPLKSSP
jgi:hypothetical protein